MCTIAASATAIALCAHPYNVSKAYMGDG
jgi:hypothetical protein